MSLFQTTIGFETAYSLNIWVYTDKEEIKMETKALRPLIHVPEGLYVP
jgi:hypothetical protein